MKTLLDLDHTPTLEELRNFFKYHNDFSTATYEIDYENMPPEKVKRLEHIKKLVDEQWEPLSQKMGLKSHSSYYGKDHPLIAMRDNVQNLVAENVYKLAYENPLKAIFYILKVMISFKFKVNPDLLLHNAVETTMKTMSYEETAEILNSDPAYEDFNHKKYNNHRATDFDRKWNHTRAGIKTVYTEDLVNDDIADTSFNVEELVASNIKMENFWSQISDEDKKIIQLRMDGYTQEEISEELGYKTHTAITKRLKKLKETFENIA